MLSFLRQRTGLRGAIGVVAAYAFALQMLLTGLAGAQIAAADPAGQSVICYGVQDETAAGDHEPASNSPRIHHVTCVVCAVVSLAPPLPEAASPAVFRTGRTADYLPADGRPYVVARRHDPKSAQGPPQTV